MRILVLSDIHRKSLNLNLKGYDYIICCGDYGNTRFKNNDLVVRGNCDKDGAKELIENIFSRRVFISHGDLYNVKYRYDNIFYRTKELDCSVCFFGHTHKGEVFIYEDILFLNPGAYQNNEYAIVEDNSIKLYKDDKVIKEFAFKW